MGAGAAAHLRRGRVRRLGEGGLRRLRAGVQGAPRALEDVACDQVLAQPARRRQVSGRVGPGWMGGCALREDPGSRVRDSQATGSSQLRRFWDPELARRGGP